jgi:hypothetical protein
VIENQNDRPVNGGRKVRRPGAADASAAVRRRFKFEPVEEKPVKAAISTQRIVAIVGVALLITFLGWFLSPSPRQAPPVTDKDRPATGPEAVPGVQSAAAPATAALNAPDAEERPVYIQGIRLTPDRPSRQDTVKVEIETTAATPGGISYRYQWKINGRIVDEATEDTLSLAGFKKGDLITVAVTPTVGRMAGFMVESQPVAIHAVPPSLELKDVPQSRKAGESLELQMAGAAPDGEQLTFSLEAPQVPGMTIDKRSGRISWRPEPNQKGAIRFGASAEDNNGTKVTKIFEINIQ